MKHLKKYSVFEHSHEMSNESDIWKSLNKPIEKEFFDMIFADFIDNGAKTEHSKDGYEIYIMEEEGSYNNIDNYVEYTKALNEMALDMKTCIDRVKDEYPDIKVRFYYDDGFDPIGGSQKDAYYTIYFDNR